VAAPLAGDVRVGLCTAAHSLRVLPLPAIVPALAALPRTGGDGDRDDTFVLGDRRAKPV